MMNCPFMFYLIFFGSSSGLEAAIAMVAAAAAATMATGLVAATMATEPAPTTMAAQVQPLGHRMTIRRQLVAAAVAAAPMAPVLAEQASKTKKILGYP